MAVTYLPSGLEELGPALGLLGQNATRYLMRDQLRERMVQDMLLQNPEAAQIFGRMTSQATANVMPAEGADAIAAETQRGAALQPLADIFGLRPELLASLAQTYQPDASQQARDVLSRDPSYVQSLVGAAKQEPQTSLVTGQAQAENARNELDFARLVRENGMLQLRIDSEKLQTQLGVRMSEFQMKNLTEYTEWANTLPDDLKGIATASLANPGLVSFIANREQMQFEADQRSLDRQMQARLASMRAQGNPMEQMIAMFNFRANVQKEISDSMDRFDKAVEDGSEEKARVEMHRLNTLTQYQRNLFPNEPTFDARETSGLFRTKFGYDPLVPLTDLQQIGTKVEQAANTLAQGGNFQDLTSTEWWRNADGATRSAVLDKARTMGWGQQRTLSPPSATPPWQHGGPSPQQSPGIPDWVIEAMRRRNAPPPDSVAP